MRRICAAIGLAVFFLAPVCGQPTADSLDSLFRTRKVPVAFGLSAVVPGAGQAYNRHWIKGAAIIAAEAVVAALYATWRREGLDGRDAYERTAHMQWSPVRYAYWLNDYAQYLDQLPNPPLQASPVDITAAVRAVDLTRPDQWSDAEAVAVRRLILDVRRLEGVLYHAATGAAFSHVLPFFGEQQYYELIGKYFQYAPGWADYSAIVRNGAPRWITADGTFIPSIDPDAGPEHPHVTDSFYRYADDHAHSNDYLRRASRLTAFLLANHLLAAVDAAIFARLHNRRAQLGLSVAVDAGGRAVLTPALRLRIAR